MPVNVFTKEEVLELLQPLKQKIDELERKLNKKERAVCKMKKAQEILQCSNVQIVRLIHAGVV